MVHFEQVDVRWKPVLWHSIYTRAERRHRSTVVIDDFDNITPPSCVSTVEVEHVFIFWV